MFRAYFKSRLRTMLINFRHSVVASKNSHARISPHVLFDGPEYRNVKLGKGVSIGAYTVIVLESPKNMRPEVSASLTIGDNTYIGELNNIRVNVPTVIGSYCLISQGVSIITTNHGKAAGSLVSEQAWDTSKSGVVIEDGVWIGANCCILPGVRLSRDCVVAAGAVVTKHFEPFSIIAGVPAIQIGSRLGR